MKMALIGGLLAMASQCALAEEDITFSHRLETFTNLQGQSFSHVQLIRADQDGLIWRDGASGGRICYTNLAPDLLEWFGIPTNRIETARMRAGQKALADARYRAQKVIPLRSPSLPTSRTNATFAAQEPQSTPIEEARMPENPYPAYPSTIYPPLFVYGLDPAPSARSSRSAPGANPTGRAGSVPMSGSAPNAATVARSGPALAAPPALPARRAVAATSPPAPHTQPR